MSSNLDRLPRDVLMRIVQAGQPNFSFSYEPERRELLVSLREVSSELEIFKVATSGVREYVRLEALCRALRGEPDFVVLSSIDPGNKSWFPLVESVGTDWTYGVLLFSIDYGSHISLAIRGSGKHVRDVGVIESYRAFELWLPLVRCDLSSLEGALRQMIEAQKR